jgi:hypothetical protein
VGLTRSGSGMQVLAIEIRVASMSNFIKATHLKMHRSPHREFLKFGFGNSGPFQTRKPALRFLDLGRQHGFLFRRCQKEEALRAEAQKISIARFRCR